MNSQRNNEQSIPIEAYLSFEKILDLKKKMRPQKPVQVFITEKKHFLKN